nr:hypothetical protein Iba_chr01cCG1830 [Ipomoea batatas]
METRLLSLLLSPIFLLFNPTPTPFLATTFTTHSQIPLKSPPSARAPSKSQAKPGDSLDVSPLQSIESDSSFTFDPPTVFTELELDIPHSIRPNTNTNYIVQAQELVGLAGVGCWRCLRRFSLFGPYEILDFIDISDIPMDDKTPLGNLPHPSTDVSFLHRDPLDVALLQSIEPDSSFSFEPLTVFTEVELDIPRSIRPNTNANHIVQAEEQVGSAGVEVLASPPDGNDTEPFFWNPCAILILWFSFPNSSLRLHPPKPLSN